MKKSIIYIVIAYCFANCKKHNEIIDPCKDHQPMSINFIVEEEYSASGKKMETDTILSNRRITLTADKTFNYYTWMANGSRLNGLDYITEAFFDSSGLYKLKLIGSRKANNKCPPFDNGIDSIEKNIVVLPDPQNSTVGSTPLIGKFIGSCLSDPTHFFEIEIGKFPMSIGSPDSLIGINNFPDGCTEHWFIDFNYIGFSAFTFGDPGEARIDCDYITTASGFLESNRKTLIINFNRYINNQNVKDTFNGEKL